MTAIMECRLLWTLAVFAVVTLLHHPIEAHITDIIVEDDIGEGGKTNSVEPVPPEDSVGGECHVEFQVMKRVLGRCVKLGHNTRGCVAGTFLRPFHPECM